MRIKSYFAGSVEAAMSQARRELGPEAMLVQSRKAPLEAREKGEYEVVFADADDPEPDPAVEAAPQAPAPLLAELAVVRTELEQMRKAITRNASNIPAWLPPNSPLADLYAALIGQEVDGGLAQRILLNVQNRLGRNAEGGLAAARRSGAGCGPEQVEAAARVELEDIFDAGFELHGTSQYPPVLALVGPPGAGKTATLAKLAVRYGLVGRRSTRILSLDNHRVGASEQLRVYAGILGVGFQSVDSAQALAQAIEESRNKRLILIDTPGFARNDFESAGELAHFLATNAHVEPHLVLPASMRAADVERAAESFDCFRPRKLIFTKLDETGSFGPILNIAVRTGKPVSFVTTGQRVPEDLEPASCARIVDLILPDTVAKSALTAA
jgi:flagellar biosynthesis protein FlhF